MSGISALLPNPFHPILQNSKHVSGIVGFPVEAQIATDFREARAAGHKNWFPTLHRLEHGKPKTLRQTWKEERLAVFIEPLPVAVRNLSQQDHSICQAFFLNLTLHECPIRRRFFTSHHQARIGHALHEIKEHVDILMRHSITDCQPERPPRHTRRPDAGCRRPRSQSQRNSIDRAASHVQMLFDILCHIGRIGHDGRGSVDFFLDLSLLSGNGMAASLMGSVVQKVEVVNGKHHRHPCIEG